MNEQFDNPDKLVLSLEEFTDPTYEAGGLILERDGKYVFIAMPNQHHGTPTGRGLFQPTEEDLARLAGPLFRDGWMTYASFHTHPAFSSHYSGIDYNFLFDSFKVNYIKSIRNGDIVRYTWINDKDIESETIKEPTLSEEERIINFIDYQQHTLQDPTIMDNDTVDELLYEIETADMVTVGDSPYLRTDSIKESEVIGEPGNVLLQFKWYDDNYNDDRIVRITEEGLGDAAIENNTVYCRDEEGEDIAISLFSLTAKPIKIFQEAGTGESND